VRLAFVSPLPPAPTGIADYTADVLRLLAPSHEIDAFHDQEQVDGGGLPPACGLHRTSTLLARHAARPYDLVVYQMGNGRTHDRVYDLLPRLPGLLVLHDLVLHHSRAGMFLESPEARAYARDPSSARLREAAERPLRAYAEELAYTYPAQAGRLDQAFLETVGDLLPYAYPLFRIPVEAARLVAVHNDFMADTIRAEVEGAEVVRIPMAAEAVAVSNDAVMALRARHGLAADDFVVGSFGLVTREKRVETIARAVARAAAHLPALRLLLVGPVADPDRLRRVLQARGILERTLITDRVPLADLPAYMGAADLAVHLRYPTGREASAALLRVLAQGRPTVVSDLEHLADIPDGAVVRADPTDEEGEVTRAILRLHDKPEARARLGRAAAEFVRREHSPARCRDAYEAAIARAAAMPDPPPRPWPGHWPRPGSSPSA
jgi:glycosyltransferase involved in cell wall biosynthesis